MPDSPREPETPGSQQKWPDRIYLVRHGQSAGNVARDAAEAAGEHWIDIATRDVDTPPDQRPNAFFASPYSRALETTTIVLEAGKFPEDARVVHDERLREKEFGILDRMTRFGIQATYPRLDEQDGVEVGLDLSPVEVDPSP